MMKTENVARLCRTLQRSNYMALVYFIAIFSLFCLNLAAQQPAVPATPADQVATPPSPPQPKEITNPAPKQDSFVAKAETSGKGFRLTLRDAVKMALENNLTIAISDYESENYFQRMRGDQGVYDPALVSSVTLNSNVTPNTSPYNQSLQGSNLTRGNLLYSFGLQQVIPTGGNWSLSWDTTRGTTNSNSSFFSPSYNAGFTFRFTQPLMKNFRTNSAARQIKLTKLDANTNDITFEDQVTTVIKNVQDAYWDLVYAIRDHEIRRNSLELAKIQLDNNRRRVEIGTLAPIEITNAESTVSTREQTMISALERISTIQNRMKQFISRDAHSSLWDNILIPTDEPVYIQSDVTLAEAVDSALTNRPEIRKMKNEITKLDVNENFYRNQKRPQVDLITSLGSIGQAGDVTSVGEGKVLPRFIGNMFTAYGQIMTFDFRNYSVGLQVTIPVRNRSVEANLAQQLIAKQQYQKRLRDTEQTIQVDVRNAYEAIQTNRQMVETAKKGLQLARDQLDGENKRFEAGLTTTFMVLTRQDQYEQAQGSELQSLVNYRKSLSALYKAMFKTLDKNDIEIAKSQPDAGPSAK